MSYTLHMSGVAKHRIQVELPAEAFSHHPLAPHRLAEELKTLWFLEQVRQRRLGFSRASELAGIPLARFLELMGEHQITPFDYDSVEITQELC